MCTRMFVTKGLFLVCSALWCFKSLPHVLLVAVGVPCVYAYRVVLLLLRCPVCVIRKWAGRSESCVRSRLSDKAAWSRWWRFFFAQIFLRSISSSKVCLLHLNFLKLHCCHHFDDFAKSKIVSIVLPFSALVTFQNHMIEKFFWAMTCLEYSGNNQLKRRVENRWQ